MPINTIFKSLQELCAFNEDSEELVDLIVSENNDQVPHAKFIVGFLDETNNEMVETFWDIDIPGRFLFADGDIICPYIDEYYDISFAEINKYFPEIVPYIESRYETPLDNGKQMFLVNIEDDKFNSEAKYRVEYYSTFELAIEVAKAERQKINPDSSAYVEEIYGNDCASYKFNRPGLGLTGCITVDKVRILK
jgi:hypothetical protein